jgi:hypothetical protein
MPKSNKRALSLLLGLEVGQEEQVSLLMLKVEPVADPAVYIPQLSRLRPLDLERMGKECPHCHVLPWVDERQEKSPLKSPS